MSMLVLASWNYLQADDYICHWLRQGHGFWGMQRWIYFNNTGRFTSAFLAALASEHDIIFRAPWIFPVIVICAETGAYFLLVRTVWKQDWITTLTISIFLFLLHMIIIPEPATAVYWFSGAATYEVPFILLILLATSMYRLLNGGPLHLLPISAMLVALIGGSNEMSALVFNLSFVFITYSLYRTNSIRKFHWVILTFFALVSLVILFISPGIRLRRSYMPDPEVVVAIPATLAWATYALWEILKEPAFWLAMLVAFLFSNTGRIRGLPGTRPIIILACIQLFSLSIISYHTRGSVPLRMLNVYTSSNALLILLASAALGKAAPPLPSQITPIFLRTLALFAVVLILFSNLSGDIVQSFFSAPVAKSIQQKWISSIENVSSKSMKYVTLPSYEESADSILNRGTLKSVIKNMARNPPILLQYHYDKSNEITFYHLIVRNNLDSVRMGNEIFIRPEWALPASR